MELEKQLSMAAEGTGQKVLAHNKFKDMIVDVPDEKEQIKIELSLNMLITSSHNINQSLKTSIPQSVHAGEDVSKGWCRCARGSF